MVDIRPAEPTDLDRLRAIQRATLAEPWPELLETAVEGPLDVLVAGGDLVAGYAIFVPGPDAPGYVPELAVDPRHQRAGLGSALLDEVCQRLEADGHDAVRLTVRDVDEDARSFYRSQGFEEVDRVTDHFESSDGLVLERDLRET